MEDERLPPSAIWGMTLGITAWSVLLTAFFFASGALESALTIGIPCMVISAGFAALIVVTMRGVSATLGFRTRPWFETLWALLLYFMGLLLLLSNEWVLPALREAGIITRDYHPVMGVGYVPDWIPIILLVAGPVLLIRVARAARRASP